jgi:DNA polymerase alpha subunit A
MDDDAYAKLQEERRANNFIVGDDDGYKDHGEEIWERDDDYYEDGGSKRKANKPLPAFFLRPGQDSKSKKKTTNTALSHNKPAVSNEQSNAVMEDLFKRYDNDENVDEIGGKYEPGEDNNVGFNIYDQLDQQYDVALPTAPGEAVAQPSVAPQSSPSLKRQPGDVTSMMEDDDYKENKGSYVANPTESVSHNVLGSHNEDVEMEPEDNNEGRVTPSVTLGSDGKLTLPLNTDSTLSVFWLDAHEDFVNSQEVYLFGKVYDPSQNKYFSVGVIVRGIDRIMYVVPKQDHTVRDVLPEVKQLFDTRFSKIKRWRSRPVNKSYCFEMPVKKGISEFLEVRYSSEYPPLQNVTKGKTFDHIFGKNTSVLETFLVQAKLMGPSWITIKNPKLNTDIKKTWCDFEIVIDNPRNIESTIEDKNKPSPPIKVMSFAMKSFKNAKKTKEICMISCLIHEQVECDRQTNNPERGYKTFSLVRKLEHLPYPLNFTEDIKNSKSAISSFANEKALLEFFITKVAKLDPDLLVAHGMCEGMFDTLMDRIEKNKVNMWSRIGRFKRSQIPKKMTKDGSQFGGFWMPRQATVGRMLCDTFLSARELVRETNYDLTELAATQLGKKREDFDPAVLVSFYKKKSQDLISVITHTEKDAFLTVELLFKLAIIPLTKQLTNIAGNLWFRSLQNARAERNEWLLLHEFNSKEYICPDKDTSKKNRQVEDEEKEQGDDGKPGKRKKAAYEGGLVLEPKPGLYDKIVLLLDFNSLYPSIIQEYNLCFTTVDRCTTHDFDGREISDAKLDEVDVPDNTKHEKTAILPNILKMLVDKRRAVRTQMKSEKDKNKLEQLDIKQKALKLTANSMYGCLGFSSSRFYAKAIAALITRKGRDALQDTVKITTDTLNYNVVYGDTDSIMIYTGINILKEALSIGEQIKKEVNKRYKCLEIEIDGVFRSLLLLKKKKYAALVYEDINDPNSFRKKEVKGLDMVRRDWCPLSKEIGNHVLSEILSSKSQDEIQINLRAYFTNIAEKLKNNQIKMKDFIITKQLTRTPSEYTSADVLPHVCIANRLKAEQGKTDNELVSLYIPYIICEGEAKQYAKRAFTPEEITKAQGKLKVDIDWYLSQQIYPPISRLIAHVEGIDGQFICECFGLDSKKHNLGVSHTVNKTEDDYQQKFLDVAKNKDNLDKYKGKRYAI